MRFIDWTQHTAYLKMAGVTLHRPFDPATSTWLASIDREPHTPGQGIPLSSLLGVVVFTNYTDFDVEMFVASWSKRWATNEFLKGCFKYAFDQLQVDRVTARCLASNWVARRMVQRLGFKEEGVIRRGHAGENVFLYGMLKSECRWVTNGQKVDTESAERSRPDEDHRGAGKVQPLQHYHPVG